MDVIVHDGASRLLIDAVIVSAYAGCSSFRRACARRDGHAARRAEVAKRARYASAELIPFAVEKGRRLGPDTRAFVLRCANAAEDPDAQNHLTPSSDAGVFSVGIRKRKRENCGQGSGDIEAVIREVCTALSHVALLGSPASLVAAMASAKS